MHPWTDSKVRVHAFYCMLGIWLLESIHKEAAAARPGLSREQLIAELAQIQPRTLLYAPQGQKSPRRVATILSKQPLAQQSLAEVLALNHLRSTECW